MKRAWRRISLTTSSLTVLLSLLGCGDQKSSSKTDHLVGIDDQIAAQRKTLADYLDIIATEELTLETLLHAQEQLIAADPHAVLPLLLERRLSVSMGQWNGYPSTKMNLEHLPPEPRAFYEYNTVWNTILNREREAVVPLLIQMLADTDSGQAQRLLIYDLRHYWSDEVHDAMMEVFEARRMDQGWYEAARRLSEHDPSYIQHQTMVMLREMPTETFPELQIKSDLLRYMMNKRRRALDANGDAPPILNPVLDHAFNTLRQLQDFPNIASYYLARDLERYLSKTFQPDKEDERYQSQGASLLYQADTVTNALKWWEANDDNDPANRELGGAEF